MTFKYLPDRPVGVRKSWRKSVPDLAVLGEQLCLCSVVVRPEWGDPIEAAEYRERKGPLRRVEALYANRRWISISFRRDGHRIERLRSVEL